MRKVFFFVVAFAALSIVSPILIAVYDLNPADIAIEFHGLLMDVLVLGILLALYESTLEKRREINRWLDELDDYRGLSHVESGYRVKGILARLNRSGYFNIELYDLSIKVPYLSQVEVSRGKTSFLDRFEYLRNKRSQRREPLDTCAQNFVLKADDFRSSVFNDVLFEDSKIHAKLMLGISFNLCEFNNSSIRLYNSHDVCFNGCQFNSMTLKIRKDRDYVGGSICFDACRFYNVRFKEGFFDGVEVVGCRFVECKGVPDHYSS